MTRVLVAASAWKGSFGAPGAARAIAAGVRAADPWARVERVHVADGGDGTAAVLAERLGARARTTVAAGPMGARHRAPWFLHGRVAMVDLASVCGLGLVRGPLRPLEATTRGLGDVLRAALDEGASTLWVGLGGSASVDAGTGAITALGARFLDGSGRELPDGGGALVRVARIDRSGLDPRIASARILLLCDVRNPLLGPEGAAPAFAPQKGAGRGDVARLDAGLARLARVASWERVGSFGALRCGGAAGGAAAGLAAMLGARILDGAAAVLDLVGFDRRLVSSDLVLCGEGRYEGSRHAGKVTHEVLLRAARHGIPATLVCASARPGSEAPGHAAIVRGPGGVLDAAGLFRLARIATASALSATGHRGRWTGSAR